MGYIILIIIILFVVGGARAGKFFSRSVKGTVRTTGKFVDKTLKESGEFVKGAVEEFKETDSREYQQEIVKYCPECGSSLPENSRFCPNCGTHNESF